MCKTEKRRGRIKEMTRKHHRLRVNITFTNENISQMILLIMSRSLITWGISWFLNARVIRHMDRTCTTYVCFPLFFHVMSARPKTEAVLVAESQLGSCTGPSSSSLQACLPIWATFVINLLPFKCFCNALPNVLLRALLTRSLFSTVETNAKAVKEICDRCEDRSLPLCLAV